MSDESMSAIRVTTTAASPIATEGHDKREDVGDEFGHLLDAELAGTAAIEGSEKAAGEAEEDAEAPRSQQPRSPPDPLALALAMSTVASAAAPSPAADARPLAPSDLASTRDGSPETAAVQATALGTGAPAARAADVVGADPRSALAPDGGEGAAALASRAAGDARAPASPMSPALASALSAMRAVTPTPASSSLTAALSPRAESALAVAAPAGTAGTTPTSGGAVDGLAAPVISPAAPGGASVDAGASRLPVAQAAARTNAAGPAAADSQTPPSARTSPSAASVSTPASEIVDAESDVALFAPSLDPSSPFAPLPPPDDATKATSTVGASSVATAKAAAEVLPGAAVAASALELANGHAAGLVAAAVQTIDPRAAAGPRFRITPRDVARSADRAFVPEATKTGETTGAVPDASSAGLPHAVSREPVAAREAGASLVGGEGSPAAAHDSKPDDRADAKPGAESTISSTGSDTKVDASAPAPLPGLVGAGMSSPSDGGLTIVSGPSGARKAGAAAAGPGAETSSGVRERGRAAAVGAADHRALANGIHAEVDLGEAGRILVHAEKTEGSRVDVRLDVDVARTARTLTENARELAVDLRSDAREARVTVSGPGTHSSVSSSGEGRTSSGGSSTGSGGESASSRRDGDHREPRDPYAHDSGTTDRGATARVSRRARFVL